MVGKTGKSPCILSDSFQKSTKDESNHVVFLSTAFEDSQMTPSDVDMVGG